jgi:hypothetical protein
MQGNGRTTRKRKEKDLVASRNAFDISSKKSGSHPDSHTKLVAEAFCAGGVGG